VGLWVVTPCTLVTDYLHFGRNNGASYQARSWPIQDGGRLYRKGGENYSKGDRRNHLQPEMRKQMILKGKTQGQEVLKEQQQKVRMP
jgi:hypothetical protein